MQATAEPSIIEASRSTVGREGRHATVLEAMADGNGSKERATVEYTDVLRLLAINDARFGEECAATGRVELGELDPKTLALVRLAALISVGGAEPSYGAEADAAVDAGAKASEIVDVLVGVVPVVGLPCVVAAAPKLAMALGYDVDEALEQQSG
jgi:alkylhydroperoxidase/carboxymuconolactone decarboxylase family protein YurZ